MLKRGDVCIITGRGSNGSVNAGVPVVVLDSMDEEGCVPTQALSDELLIEVESGEYKSRGRTHVSRLVKFAKWHTEEGE